MDNLSRKERVAQKRVILVQELYLSFVHSYEMSRAWNMKSKLAYNKADKEFNYMITHLIKEKPQEKSFIFQCRSEARERIKKRIQELEIK